MADISKTYACSQTVKSIINKLVDANIRFIFEPDGVDRWKISVKSDEIKRLSLSRLEGFTSSLNGIVGRSPLSK